MQKYLRFVLYIYIQIEKKSINIDNLRILYKNLNLLLETEIRKLKQYIEELKSTYQQQDNKLNKIVEKTTNILQEYEFIEYEINSMNKKVISKGEKVTVNTLNKIFSTKNNDPQIFFILKILHEIIILNINSIEDNSNMNSKINESNNNSTINTIINKDNKITWEFLKHNITYKSILLLLSFISETSNLTLSKEIMESASPIITKYNHYKNCYANSFPEIMIIIDFIKILIVYYTKLALAKKLFISNKNKNSKMETIQLDLDKIDELIQKTKIILNEITKDYNSLKKNKNKNDKIIYGYNILEKYSLYEKYTVCQENIYNYDDKYYNNYGGNDYNNKLSKIKYVIKLNKNYRNKEKFLHQLSSSLISYSRGIRKINKEKFIQNIKENKDNSINKTSNTNSLTKNNTSISMHNNNNNLLLKSIESNNSFRNLFRSFQSNSKLNVTRNNSTPYRSETSRNSIFVKKSFVDSYPTFDNFFQSSNVNILLKDGLNNSSVDWEQSKTHKKNISSNFNSLKNSVNKPKNQKTVCFRNLKQHQINLKFENEQWSPCSFCCKNIKNNVNKNSNK